MSAAILKSHEKDLGGGFVVRRLLPSAVKQAVGPFIFFDHFGPIDVAPDANHDVRPVVDKVFDFDDAPAAFAHLAAAGHVGKVVLRLP